MKNTIAAHPDQKRLAVIVPDRLSVLLAKGEIVERYYNPGNIFDVVHLVMTNDDTADVHKLQPLVGRAKLFLHNIPASPSLFVKTLGYRPLLLRPWVDRALALLGDIAPDLVRVHDGFLECHLAAQARQHLGIPYVVSLHGVWDRDRLYPSAGMDWLYKRLVGPLQAVSLAQADAVICVYKPIVRYARKCGAKNVHLVYNPVSRNIQSKQDYTLSDPPRLLTVNRQVAEKNPENIIRAVRHLNCAYDIVGQGPLHESLRALVRELGLESRVTFIPSLPNAALLERLPGYDVAVFHCDYWGISKGILEASLAGMPVVANRHPVEPIPDYAGDWLVACENTEEGYRRAIGGLLADADMRRALGVAARTHAATHWDPEKMEAAVAAVYGELLATREMR